MIRPSYVLGGRAMEIVHDEAQLARYIAEAVVVSGKSPVLIDSYLRDAIEVDVDAVADGKDVFICGMMEHIEEAGMHSGDSRLLAAAPFAEGRYHRRDGAADGRARAARSMWSG